jgi:hypothetical protein
MYLEIWLWIGLHVNQQSMCMNLSLLVLCLDLSKICQSLCGNEQWLNCSLVLVLGAVNAMFLYMYEKHLQCD